MFLKFLKCSSVVPKVFLSCPKSSQVVPELFLSCSNSVPQVPKAFLTCVCVVLHADKKRSLLRRWSVTRIETDCKNQNSDTHMHEINLIKEESNLPKLMFYLREIFQTSASKSVHALQPLTLPLCQSPNPRPRHALAQTNPPPNE